MTDRELMQMALDALEAMQSYARAEKKGLRICDESIEALRDRLAKPDREWVELTDEEIDTAVKSCNTVDTYKYFRAIEAKLKEKNS